LHAWLINTATSLSQALLLTMAAWSWAAFCTVLIARVVSSAGYITATTRTLRVASVSAAVSVTAATVDVYFFPRAELLGIDKVVISPPYTWWVWAGILLCEPAVTGFKVVSNRGLLRSQAEREGKPVEYKPNWVKLVEGIFGNLLDVNNYV
jgi:small-conductance mechanosensitive channel